jgi:hypothetical protein
MWGVKLAVAVGAAVISVTVALATSPSAQTGVPDIVNHCLAAEDIGGCFADELAQAPPPGAIPDDVAGCLEKEDIGTCFRDLFAQAPPPGAGIPGPVQACLDETPLQRAACFRKLGG